MAAGPDKIELTEFISAATEAFDPATQMPLIVQKITTQDAMGVFAGGRELRKRIKSMHEVSRTSQIRLSGKMETIKFGGPGAIIGKSDLTFGRLCAGAAQVMFEQSKSSAGTPAGFINALAASAGVATNNDMYYLYTPAFELNFYKYPTLITALMWCRLQYKTDVEDEATLLRSFARQKTMVSGSTMTSYDYSVKHKAEIEKVMISFSRSSRTLDEVKKILVLFKEFVAPTPVRT